MIKDQFTKQTQQNKKHMNLNIKLQVIETKLIEFDGEKDKSTVIYGSLNTPF